MLHLSFHVHANMKGNHTPLLWGIYQVESGVGLFCDLVLPQWLTLDQQVFVSIEKQPVFLHWPPLQEKSSCPRTYQQCFQQLSCLKVKRTLLLKSTPLNLQSSNIDL